MQTMNKAGWAARFGRLLGIAALAAGVAAGPAAAQDNYPSKPVRVVVPYPPGGGADFLARLLAERVQSRLGQTVIVENRGGAGGMIGLQGVLQAPRDGHTIALVVPATMITLPLTSASYKIKPLQDFEPITAAVDTFLTLVVSPSSGIRTLADFIAHAKRNEGKLNYGTPGAGTSFHLNNLLMARRLGIRTTHIPYQGEVQFLNDVASGVLNYALVSSAGKPYIDGGRVVPLAMSAPARSKCRPDVPTFAEQGVPALTLTEGTWVMASSKTPPAVVNRLSEAIVESLKDAAAVQALKVQADIAPLGSRALAARLRKDYDERGAGIKAAGFTAGQG